MKGHIRCQCLRSRRITYLMWHNPALGEWPVHYKVQDVLSDELGRYQQVAMRRAGLSAAEVSTISRWARERAAAKLVKQHRLMRGGV